MNKYTVAIIGCGSIGALKDSVYDRPDSDAILTHAHAFHAHPKTKLNWMIDRDVTKALNAAEKWQCSWGDGTAFLIADPVDIIVVATPTASHRDTLMRVLALKPKLVIAEKPFCSSLKEAQEVHDVYTAAGVPIAINYTRRFDPIAETVFADLGSGVYGHIFHARCIYGRGLRRDGCHAVDIFNHVLGQCTGLHVYHPAVDDNCEAGDATLNIRLEYGKVAAHLIGVDSRAWGAFELEFITEAGVVAFPDWGKRVAIRRANNETTFGQYKALGWPAKLDATALTKALLYVANNCVQHLDTGEPLKCTSADAIRVHEILENIKGGK